MTGRWRNMYGIVYTCIRTWLLSNQPWRAYGAPVGEPSAIYIHAQVYVICNFPPKKPDNWEPYHTERIPIVDWFIAYVASAGVWLWGARPRQQATLWPHIWRLSTHEQPQAAAEDGGHRRAGDGWWREDERLVEQSENFDVPTESHHSLMYDCKKLRLRSHDPMYCTCIHAFTLLLLYYSLVIECIPDDVGRGKQRRLAVKGVVRDAENMLDNSEDSEWEGDVNSYIIARTYTQS